jgi:hypothetical protein
MKHELSVNRDAYLRLLLMVPAISLLGFTGCSSVDPPARIQANLLSSAAGNHEIGDNVTIGPRTYDSKDQSFESRGRSVRNPIPNRSILRVTAASIRDLLKECC